MKVKEAIEILQTLDQDKEFYIEDRGYGCLSEEFDIEVFEKFIVLNPK